MRWNFEKWLVDKKGVPVKHYASGVRVRMHVHMWARAHLPCKCLPGLSGPPARLVWRLLPRPGPPPPPAPPRPAPPLPSRLHVPHTRLRYACN